MLVSLWATITNAIPASVVFVVLIPLFVVALPRTHAVSGTVFSVLALYSYFALSTALYAPESFFDPEFYRRDGNFFVTFLPVLIGGIFAVRINLNSIMRCYVIWAGFVNLIFLSLYLTTGGTIIFEEEGIYHLLFEAHNAAGGYLATLASFAIGVYYNSKKGVGKAIWLALVASILAGLFLTDSRGSMGALLVAVILVFVLKERFLKTTIASLVVITIIILSFTYPTWVAGGKALDLTENTSTEGIGAKDANVLQRALYLWPRALDLFIDSPIFGTGYGSYNDTPYQLVGVPHVFEFNRPTELIFNSWHAHNTYLHVLAENGVVGLALLIAMLVKIRKSILSVQTASVRLGLKLAFWVAVFSSMTEHRLFTPAQMLPFTILLGLTLANLRRDAILMRLPTNSAAPDAA